MDSVFQVVSTPQHASVSVRTEDKPLSQGSAEANCVGNGKWWVARVFLRPQFRGQGLGKELVARLIHAVKDQGGTLLEVAPGGYGESYEDQERFYQSCGFKVVEPGLLHFHIVV